MSRSKKAGKRGSGEVNTLTGLREPFPSSPTRPPKYAVYCRYPFDAEPGQSRLIVMTFAATYAAKHFVDTVLQNGNYRWLAANKKLGIEVPDTIVGENGVEIRCPGGTSLEDIMEYEFSESEAAWELPQEMARQADMVRREYRDETPPSTEEGEEAPAKPKKEPKPVKEKIDKSGMVSIGEIAEQMGIEPRDARGSLRKQKVEKPAAGWCWPESEVEGVKKVIKKGLK